MTTPNPQTIASDGESTSFPLPDHAFRSAQFLAQLEAEILIRREELDALVRARDVLRGTHTPAHARPHAPARPNGHRAPKNGTPPTVADMVEQILAGASSDGNGLHVNHLATELQSQFKTKITSKNLINTLNRWVSRRKRFKRIAPNTFALDPAKTARRG